jgi:hypothetical protein
MANNMKFEYSYTVVSDKMPSEDMERITSFEYVGSDTRWIVLLFPEYQQPFLKIRSEVELFMGEHRERFTRVTRAISAEYGDTEEDVREYISNEVLVLIAVTFAKIKNLVEKSTREHVVC